jgi:hypothetical protein
MQAGAVQTSKRAEERSIKEIIQAVEKWRRLYKEGKGDDTNDRVSLEDAAKIVGINKKSLDDYLL